MQPLFLARRRKGGSRFERATDAHWTGLGHQVVAEAIASLRFSATVSLRPMKSSRGCSENGYQFSEFVRKS